MNGVLDKIFSELNYKVDFKPDSSRSYYTVYIDRESENIGFFVASSEILFLDKIEEKHYEELKTLFDNEVFPKDKPINTLIDLQDFIEHNYPDRSPEAKADRVLAYLHRTSKYDGDQIYAGELLSPHYNNWRRMFLYNQVEASFYIRYLSTCGFLEIATGSPEFVTLTVQGLERIIKVNEITISRTCFVAMSFSEELRSIYDEAVAPAIRESGFEPLKIDDEVSITSEQTINDAILAAIKKSKFTIADFTQHKAGVYFEAGYALGRGHKVIYTCQKDDIGNAHFDTRNYPHIVWKDAVDLKKQLIDKIEVFIKA
jgi:hypothetical protein